MYVNRMFYAQCTISWRFMRFQEIKHDFRCYLHLFTVHILFLWKNTASAPRSRN